MILRDAIAAAMLILTPASGTAAFSYSPQSPLTSTANRPPMAFYVAKARRTPAAAAATPGSRWKA
jgi:hypothetical protein